MRPWRHYDAGYTCFQGSEKRELVRQAPKLLHCFPTHDVAHSANIPGTFLGYCPHPGTACNRVILRALYNYKIDIIQLLLGGGRTQHIPQF